MVDQLDLLYKINSSFTSFSQHSRSAAQPAHLLKCFPCYRHYTSLYINTSFLLDLNSCSSCLDHDKACFKTNLELEIVIPDSGSVTIESVTYAEKQEQ